MGSLEAALRAACRGHPDHHVLLAGIAREQDGEDAEEEHRSIHAQLSSAFPDAAREVGREAHLDAVSRERPRGIGRSIGGQVQRRQFSGELTRPPRAVLLPGRGFEKLPFPFDKLAETGGRARSFRRLPGSETIVCVPEGACEFRRGDSVEDDVMHHDQHDRRVRLEQFEANRQSGGELEGDRRELTCERHGIGARRYRHRAQSVVHAAERHAQLAIGVRDHSAENRERIQHPPAGARGGLAIELFHPVRERHVVGR